MGKLQNKIVLITGGTSGIGLASAQLFEKEGARVIITGRNKETLDNALGKLSETALGIQSDTSNMEDITILFSTIKDKYGKLDIVFLNAGIAHFVPLDMVDEKHFDMHFNINVKGLFFSTQKSVELMRDGGSILFTTSAANQKGFAGSSIYSASKAAVRSFARTLSAELLPKGIRVNAIAPGAIETPIFTKMNLKEEEISTFKENIIQGIPMKRMGTSDETAKAVLFLVTQDSSYIIGIDLTVDGGMTQL